MKLKTDNFRFGSDLPSVVKALTQLLPDFAKQVNAVSEGRVAGSYNAAIAAPTTGLWAHGDFVRNKAPAVLGSAGSQYIVTGWMCTESGQPGTWVQCRSLTGT